MFNESCPAPGIWCQHRGIALPVFTLAVRIQMLAIWRGESQVATGLGSAAHDPCAAPHRLYLLSCRAARPAARQWGGRTSHKGHEFLTQPHPRLVA